MLACCRMKLNDHRILTALSVLMGIQLEMAGEEDMETEPSQTRPEPPQSSKPAEKMDTTPARELTEVTSLVIISV